MSTDTRTPFERAMQGENGISPLGRELLANQPARSMSDVYRTQAARIVQLEAERAELISQLAIMTEQCEHWSPVDGIKAQRQIKDARALLAKLGEK